MKDVDSFKLCRIDDVKVVEPNDQADFAANYNMDGRKRDGCMVKIKRRCDLYKQEYDITFQRIVMSEEFYELLSDEVKTLEPNLKDNSVLKTIFGMEIFIRRYNDAEDFSLLKANGIKL